jgi:hypothetical protein
MNLTAMIWSRQLTPHDAELARRELTPGLSRPRGKARPSTAAAQPLAATYTLELGVRVFGNKKTQQASRLPSGLIGLGGGDSAELGQA